MTAFIHAEIPLWDDLALHVDGNSKITASNGSYAEPRPNAFSLPHVSSCPGSTPICRASCYVHGLEKHVKDVHDLYRLNAMALQRLFLSRKSTLLSAVKLAAWIGQNCHEFRWHVSGDVMHERHAEWIADVCRRAPGVRFWIYTRTFELAEKLCTAANLTVNMSVDAYNYETGAMLAALYRQRGHAVRLCYLSHDGALPDDLPEGSVIFPDYGLRGRALDVPTDAPWWQGLAQAQRRMVCPADFFGQSEHHRCGPCNKCLVRA